jgi:hypothetical protein
MKLLRVDQRPFKRRLHEALNLWEEHRDVGVFSIQLESVFVMSEHYLHEKNVRANLEELLEKGNVKRARQFVDHLPDTTASRLVVAFQLLLMAGAVLFAVALVIGLAIFLWQHFFG